MNAIALFALVAGLLLGLLLLRRDLRRGHQRARAGRRQAGVEPSDDTHAAPWPKGYRGIPRSNDEDGTT